MKTYLLNGQWKMTRGSTGESYNVNVPSDNFTELLKLGAIPDPYYKDNEKLVEWIGREDWIYERSFNLSAADLDFEKIILSAKALDTICEVFINSALLGKGENAHLKYEFNIKQYVKAGENYIKIKFFAPVTLADKLQAEKPLPKNSNGTDGIAYIRKPHCHFGWDWGPHIPVSGITDEISVLCYNNRVKDFEVRQIHRDGRVKIKINPELEGEGEVSAKVICPDGAELPFEKNEVIIENPELWWTRELSFKEKQPLYTVIVTSGESSVKKKIGLRNIELDRSKDEYGSNFCFKLNGVPIFSKGGNWILPDSIMGRVTEETYDYYIDSALKANFNMLRIWGGAYYGSDYFYEQCDEKGLLLWQDFMFACLMYPLYEEDFVANVLKEVEYNVKRIKHHPSLMVWCGNNEIEEGNLHLPVKNKLMKSYRKFFYETLKEKLSVLDPDTPYIETSPVGSAFHENVTSDNYGDTHMWAVWHGQKPLNFYRNHLTRFCSEFGMESLPSMDAVRQFAEESDYNITSEIFNSHQKCANGNRKMMYYLFEKFYEPKRFEDLIYMTQLTQKECIRDATEHWRRNKGRCNGSVFWQFNDCWQAPSWSSVDYTGKWKALQYSARHFFEPLCVSIEDKGNTYKVYAINDLREEKRVKIKVNVASLGGRSLFTKTFGKTLSPFESCLVFEDEITADLKNIFLSVKMFEGERLLSERTGIFVPDYELNLKPNSIEKSVSYENGEIKIKLSSPVFCRSVMVDIPDFKTPFSDNYFDLLPNEEKIIRVKSDVDLSQKVNVKSLGDIPVKTSKTRNFAYRTKFFFEPENLQRWYWYSLK